MNLPAGEAGAAGDIGDEGMHLGPGGADNRPRRPGPVIGRFHSQCIASGAYRHVELCPGLEHQGLQLAGQQMRCGGGAHGAGADEDDG